jgi:hypothetical protein
MEAAESATPRPAPQAPETPDIDPYLLHWISALAGIPAPRKGWMDSGSVLGLLHGGGVLAPEVRPTPREMVDSASQFRVGWRVNDAIRQFWVSGLAMDAVCGIMLRLAGGCRDFQRTAAAARHAAAIAGRDVYVLSERGWFQIESALPAGRKPVAVFRAPPDRGTKGNHEGAEERADVLPDADGRADQH